MAKGMYIGVGGVARKVKKAYVGVGGVARKVKKAYVGIGGVAKVCFTSDPTKVVAIPDLTEAKYATAAAVNQNYAIVAGGRQGNVLYNTVDAYNSSLVRSNAPALPYTTQFPAGGSVGQYALIAGGAIDLTGGISNLLHAYNSSLTRMQNTIYTSYLMAGVSTPLYAFFVGGIYNFSGDGSQGARAVSSSLVVTGLSSTSFAGRYKGLPIADKAVFVYSNSADVYASSLTKSTLPTLSYIPASFAANDSYAILVAAFGNAVAINESLVQTAFTAGFTDIYKSGASTPNYAVFSGGQDTSYNRVNTTHIIDKNLVTTQLDSASFSRYSSNMTNTDNGILFKDYVIFAGASAVGGTYSALVDCYQL